MLRKNSDRLPNNHLLLGCATIALTALVSIFAPTRAFAEPSFDCALASVAAEHAICDTPALAKLDQQIADIYFALLETVRPTLSAQIRHQQRAFLRERNACATGGSGNAELAACIDAHMRTRLGELQIQHAEISGAPVVSGGEVVMGPGVVWRAARPDDIPAEAVRLGSGVVLCAIGLPEVPVVGTIGVGGNACQIARDGGAALEPAFYVLIADEAHLGWSRVSSVNALPDSGVDVWRDEATRVQVCRAELNTTQFVGTVTQGVACIVLFTDDTDRPVTEEILILAGFKVLTVVE